MIRLPKMKKFLPRTLFGRSLMIILVPALLLQIITTVVFFDRHWSKMTSRLANALAGEIAVIANRIEKEPSPETIKDVAALSSQNLELLISYEEGAVFREDELNVSHKHSFLTKTLKKALQENVRRPFNIKINVSDKWINIGVQLDQGVLRVSSPQHRLFSSSGYIFLLWMIFTTLILFAIAILFMRNQIRPIRRLAVAAERFGKGRDVPSFKPEGAKEVRQAARAFFDMHERVKRQVSQRTTMLASISHDLRTPLTRVKLQLAMLDPSPEIEDLKQDIGEMEKMIEGYLAFARGEGGEQSVRTDIGKMVERLVAGLKKQGKDMHVTLGDDISVPIRPVAFERSLSNVVNNAAKYASTVWIDVYKTNHRIQIVIDDNGPGIPESDFEDVFKPFTRLDESRNVDKGGVGLGLPIAKDIITSHGGTIFLEKSNRGGLRVVIEIPE